MDGLAAAPVKKLLVVDGGSGRQRRSASRCIGTDSSAWRSEAVGMITAWIGKPAP